MVRVSYLAIATGHLVWPPFLVPQDINVLTAVEVFPVFGRVDIIIKCHPVQIKFYYVFTMTANMTGGWYGTTERGPERVPVSIW
jgi:hypothetical protein